MWFDEFCHLRVTIKVYQQQWSPSVPPPVVLMREQVVAFTVELNMLSRGPEVGVTARLRLLYVIFMGPASRWRWGPELVHLGKDWPPLPLDFSGDLCESPSNKLPSSREVCVYFGGKGCVAGTVGGMTTADPGSGLWLQPSMMASFQLGHQIVKVLVAFFSTQFLF